jgi:hypothetical protein
MSIKATNFVRRLGGLTPMEKLIGLLMADHDDHKGGGAYPGMSTIAEEAGLKNRETASRITNRLVKRGILVPREPVTKEQGKPTVYRFNYNLQTCDSPVTPTCDSPVTPPVTGPVTPGPRPVTRPVTPGTQTCDSPVTQRVEGFKGKERKGAAPSSPLENRRTVVNETFSEETYLALLEFEKYRKKIRKPLTEHGLELILEKLGELRAEGHDPVKVLQQSVMNGWQGIFPLRREGSGEPKSFHERRSEKSAQAINRVVDYFQKAPGPIQRALPPTRK